MAVDNGDIIRVTAKMTINQDDVQNTYHIQSSSAAPVDDTTAATEILARLDTAYTSLIAEMSDQLTYTSIELFNITQDRPMGEFPWPVLTTGSSIDGLLPTQTSGLCLFPTTAARSQGRKFISGFVENASDALGLPDALATTSLLNYASALIAPWLVGDGEFEFGNYRKTPLRFAKWLAPIIKNVWRTQRRRATGVGS